MLEYVRKKRWNESPNKFYGRVVQEVEKMNASVYPKDAGSELFEILGWGDAMCKSILIGCFKDDYMMMRR